MLFSWHPFSDSLEQQNECNQHKHPPHPRTTSLWVTRMFSYTVPQVASAELNDEVDSYAMYLLDSANGEVQDTVDAASLDQAVRDGDDTDALLTPAYTFLETIAKTSDNYDFAHRALLAHGKLSMSSVCSTPCAAERIAVQAHLTENENGTVCDAPKLKPLVKCIEDLDSQIRMYCMQETADCNKVRPRCSSSQMAPILLTWVLLNRQHECN